ncbi:hypothetical protein WY02_15355 [Pseudonocardia sp. AL041005-10]|nr:hypothetical protein WY02_15355 [Pseudonocardia sp. AL041005-10]
MQLVERIGDLLEQTESVQGTLIPVVQYNPLIERPPVNPVHDQVQRGSLVVLAPQMRSGSPEVLPHTDDRGMPDETQ